MKARTLPAALAGLLSLLIFVPATLQGQFVATLPFTETFEDGFLQPYWTVTGTGAYDGQVSSSTAPHGGFYHFTMDCLSGGSSYARNELTLSINLGGYTNVVLTFWAKSFNDEAHGPPASPSIGGADFDGVAIRADGVSW